MGRPRSAYNAFVSPSRTTCHECERLAARKVHLHPRARHVSTIASSSPSESNEAPRNPLGVQLLAPSFSAQIFPPGSSPPPPLHPHAVSLSHAHLAAHGLSPSQGSKLKPTNFTLPPLQGKDLGEHFWNIGREAAQPWLSMAEDLARAAIPEPPSEMAKDLDAMAEVDEEGRPSPAHWIALEASLRAMMEPRAAQWLRRSGWTRYPIMKSADGRDTILGEGEAVEYPRASDGALIFDVETMVSAGPFSVMACAAGPSAWYAWISPWLLGETSQSEQLIPFGGDHEERLLVGHNVSYDRARIRDEYQLQQSKIRFMDTLSLHVAVRGMSSPQRPAWIQHRKNRAQKAAEKLLDDQQLREEQRQELVKLLGGEEVDAVGLGSLSGLNLDLEALWDMHSPSGVSMPLTLSDEVSGASFGEGGEYPKEPIQWQDISSTNSLADVASLYCNVELPKELRNIFVEAKDRGEILDQLENLLNYCARDVYVTHAVFAKVLPAFRETCSHPATFAGVLAIGSPILPVDDEWVQYQERCQGKYEEALKGVRAALIELAEGLREEHDKMCKKGEPEWWSADPWLSQLDWTAKKPKKVKLTSTDDATEQRKVPRWYRNLVLGATPPSAAQGAAVELLLLTIDGQAITKQGGKWMAGTEVLPSMPTSKQFLLSEMGRSVRSEIGAEGEAVLAAIRQKLSKADVSERLRAAAEVVLARAIADRAMKEKLSALDWKMVDPPSPADEAGSAGGSEEITWPKWYWDLFKSSSGILELTIRTKIAPLLLKVSWRGCPLYHSREHGWTYLHRSSRNPDFSTRQKPLVFQKEADAALQHLVVNADVADPVHFHKVPHSAGDDANVGSPFSKSFVGYFEDFTLRSEHPDEMGKKAARDALDLNAQCSYWVGVRDRVANQMVVWEGEGETNMGIPLGTSGMRTGEVEAARRKGLILPQIITMGTITRRAIEKTWLTASNAKKNRVGSELKAMVKAPPGWVIVGADVDSEELWICSVMGDAQFGLHGATAVGWMTLEGTKAAGTDLHSKTASILGTSRNQAKVFNYSRIYGAGIRHATQLLLKANPAMLREEATRLAKELYSSTKGNNTHSTDSFGRRFWFGGSESYVFNKLEDVALSESPRTPALDCGITAALSRKFLPKAQYANGQSGEDFMPSRINWVVQSSGVDYLHLLVTSMNHLCRHYDIGARFMLSVHDEVRYLAKEEDAHRAALALQISNLWTRAMFAFKLQMEDLPEGVAWFAQVDVDKVLRKEVDDPCVTPSQPDPIPFGQAYDIAQTLSETNGGSLYKDGRPMGAGPQADILKPDAYPPYVPSVQKHRSLGERGMLFLQAQASGDIHEVRALERRAQGLETNSAAGISDRGDVVMPCQADLDEITKRTGKSPSTRRVYTKKGTSGKAKERKKAGFPLQPSSSRSSNTHRQGPPSYQIVSSSSYSTSSTNVVSGSLLELAQQMPVRRRVLQTSPVPDRAVYWDAPEYNRFVRWFLYRRLLRSFSRKIPSKELSKTYSGMRSMVRERFRELKSRKVNPVQAAKRIEQALQLLLWTQSAPQDPRALRRIREAEVHFLKRLRQQHKLDRSRRRQPRSRFTGALYKPDMSVGAWLRLKPQPAWIGSMIHQRRRNHILRLHRVKDLVEEKKMLYSESTFYSKLSRLLHDEHDTQQSIRGRKKENDRSGSSLSETGHGVPRELKAAVDDFGSPETWMEPLEALRETMRRQFQVEWSRKAERFTPEQLQLARKYKRQQSAYRERRGLRRKAIAAAMLAKGLVKTRTGFRRAREDELAKVPRAQEMGWGPDQMGRVPGGGVPQTGSS